MAKSSDNNKNKLELSEVGFWEELQFKVSPIDKGGKLKSDFRQELLVLCPSAFKPKGLKDLQDHILRHRLNVSAIRLEKLKILHKIILSSKEDRQLLTEDIDPESIPKISTRESDDTLNPKFIQMLSRECPEAFGKRGLKVLQEKIYGHRNQLDKAQFEDLTDLHKKIMKLKKDEMLWMFDAKYLGVIDRNAHYNVLESNLLSFDYLSTFIKLRREEYVSLLNHINSAGNLPILKIGLLEEINEEALKNIIERIFEEIDYSIHELNQAFHEHMHRNGDFVFYQGPEIPSDLMSKDDCFEISGNDIKDRISGSITRDGGLKVKWHKTPLKIKILRKKNSNKFAQLSLNEELRDDVVVWTTKLQKFKFPVQLKAYNPKYFNTENYYQFVYGNIPFKWPDTTVTITEKSEVPWLKQLAIIQYGFLGALGYHVGYKGCKRAERWKILKDAFECKSVPSNFHSDYIDEWGEACSVLRLKKMAYSIAQFTKNAKYRKSANMIKAINEWEEDLSWLKKKYYSNMKSKFEWPKIEGLADSADVSF